MNVSSQPKTLYKGTDIAKISPVSEIASPVSGKIHNKTEFPPYLKDLFGQSVKDLSPEQGSKVKHLLQTFSHIFAKDMQTSVGPVSLNMKSKSKMQGR